jgi:alkaline phosphatase D
VTITGTWDRRPITRRTLLGDGVLAGGALALAAAGATSARAVASPARALREHPFTLGVASGDPRPDGVVLWSRLAPDPLDPHALDGQAIPVRWELARDEAFRRVVRRGRTTATPELAHALHVEVEGLRPGTEYFFRFDAGGHTSPTGRTLTAPPRHAPLAAYRFAFVSCNDWQDGFYTAYRHLAEEDVELVLHLGDYIYENAPSTDTPRTHDGTGEPVTLDEYRNRHALYKTDPDLQLVHARLPFAATWDDHEVDNDWGGDTPQDPEQQTPEQWRARRAAAFQAYYEHLPLRRRQLPRGAELRLYRRLRVADLATFHVLDTRQYRSRSEPCGYGTGPVCPEVLDPARTMLGERQERWLSRGLRRDDARWQVLAQQVPLTRIEVAPGPPEELKLDKWDAYPVARARLLETLGAVENPVVITGDLHDNWVADLEADFADPASATVGTEFIGTSISSDGDGVEITEEGAVALRENAHIRFHNAKRGYVTCELTPERWTTTFRTLPYVSRPGAPVATRATFVVEAGRPGAQPA